MSMPENNIIIILFRKYFFRISDEPFIFLTKKKFFMLAGCLPAFFTEVVCQAHTEIRRKHTKHPLGHRVPENFFEHFVAMVTRTKSVTMTHQKFLTLKVKFLRR